MKKAISSILAILLCALTMFVLLPASGTAAIDESYRMGDLNGDSGITVTDARLCLRAAVGMETLTERQKKAADVFGDGKVKPANARKILRVAVRIEASKEKDIELKVGESYSFMPLASAGSGKYQWSYSITPPSGIDVTEVKHMPDIPEGHTMPPGTPVEKIYTFSAKAPGVYNVYLRLIASWETTPIDEIEFTIKITE